MNKILLQGVNGSVLLGIHPGQFLLGVSVERPRGGLIVRLALGPVLLSLGLSL